jgi:hypothetical protein
MKISNLVRGSLFFGLIVLTACSGNPSSELPVIDIQAALSHEKPLKISELVKRIEYIRLETKPECLLGYGQAVMAGNFFYVKNKRPAGLFVFNSEGRFQRQISRRGKGPGEYTDFAYFDVSPDNRYLAIGGWVSVVLFYSTSGDFLHEVDASNQFFSGFRFLNSNQLVTYAAHTNAPQDKNPVMIGWNVNGLRADTLLRLDWQLQETDMAFALAYTGFYRFGNCINFMKPANDTLFQLHQNFRIIPRLVFNCGSQSMTEKDIFNSSGRFKIRVLPLGETKDFIFIGVGKADGYQILFHEKKTGETFRLPVRKGVTDEKKQVFEPDNDLEGIDLSFNGLRMLDGQWIDLLQQSDLMAFFEAIPLQKLTLTTQKYYDELQRLTRSGDPDANPIVRIIHLK